MQTRARTVGALRMAVLHALVGEGLHEDEARAMFERVHDLVTDASADPDDPDMDTLGKLAKRYDTTVKAIQRANGLRSTVIRPAVCNQTSARYLALRSMPKPRRSGWVDWDWGSPG